MVALVETKTLSTRQSRSTYLLLLWVKQEPDLGSSSEQCHSYAEFYVITSPYLLTCKLQFFLFLFCFYCSLSSSLIQPPSFVLPSANNEASSFCCSLHVRSPTAGQSSCLLYWSHSQSCCEWLLVSQDVQQRTALQWAKTMTSTQHAPAATNTQKCSQFLEEYVPP